MAAFSEISGVLLIDKPVGPTSFGVVSAVKRALHVKSAGHTGTLDPQASGLLPICIGDATRIATFITDGTKVYEGLVRFGIETDTQDAAGRATATRDASGLVRETVEAEVARLVGRQEQIVPMFSAHKVDGQRLYDLARKGLEVERPTQEIEVEEAALLDWTPPDASIRVRCSKGTYIRSLAALLGKRLETGAHLAGLRRVSSGPFSVDQAIALDDFVRRTEKEPSIVPPLLMSVERALENLPACKLDERRAASVAFGNKLSMADRVICGVADLRAGTHLRLLDLGGLVVAVGEIEPSGGIRLARVLRQRSGPGQAR